MPNFISEERIERALLQKLQHLHGYDLLGCGTEEADEEKKFAAQKLDIARHRKRMNALDVQGHDIEANFKDPAHPLQWVFLCAMWLARAMVCMSVWSFCGLSR